MVDFSDWPEVPRELRPKKLYYAVALGKPALLLLEKLGWDAINVRLMPDKTPEQKSEAIMAWLSGIRLGSIEANATVAKYVEMEMKAVGLLSGKAAAGKDIETDDGTMEDLLKFGKM
jgi:hypothetical protein